MSEGLLGFLGEYRDWHALWAGMYDCLRVHRPELPPLLEEWDEANRKNAKKRRHYYVLGYAIALVGIGLAAFGYGYLMTRIILP